MCIHRRAPENVPTGLRRATASQIETAQQEIRQCMEANNVELGPIAQQHLAMHQAHQPEGTDFTMPTDNTTRQAQSLDSRRQEQVQEEDTTINNNNQRRKKIKIQIHGSWVDVFVDVVLLREALGLPAHDIFNAGIFHQCRHNKTVGPDIADTDHGGTLENEENDSNGDPDNDNNNNTTS